MVKILLISLFISAAVSQTVSSCGVPQIVNELIVNGHPTVRGEWPWHVAIYKKIGRNGSYICGGTLVTKLHVITAAHCTVFAEIDNKTQLIGNMFVRLGVHWLNSTNRREQQRRMIRKIHNFLKNNKRNDIAILELDMDVEFGEYVQPACVSLTQDLTGQLGTVIGWGLDETDRISNVLKSALLPVIDFHTCLSSDRVMFGKKLHGGIICAGYTNGTAVCNGDSGGGLFFEEKGVWYLGGIVSFSKLRSKASGLCYVRGYGAFTRIYGYICWIKSVTRLPIDDDQCDDPAENYTKLFPQDCGLNDSRKSADVPEYPWMAILRYENPPHLNGFCEGTLIHKRYVLTHALCTSRVTPDEVQLGERTIGESWDCEDFFCVSLVRYYGIESIVHHPAFAKEIKTTSSNAIEITPSLMAVLGQAVALIRLDRDVQFEDHIRPLCLPVTRSLRDHALPAYTVAGWQFGSNSRPSSTLLTTKVTSDPAGCKDLQHQANISISDLLCTDDSSRAEICSYNFGGPLGANVRYQQRDERFVQFGVLFSSSILLSCDFSHAISVGKHMDWIVANIRT